MEPYSDFKIEGYNEKENYYKRKKKPNDAHGQR